MEENKDYNPSQYEDDDRMEAPKSAKSIRGYQTIIVILAVILAALSILYFNIHRQQQEEYDLLLVDRDSIKSNLSHLMEDFDNLQISNDSISQSLGLERSRADAGNPDYNSFSYIRFQDRADIQYGQYEYCRHSFHARTGYCSGNYFPAGS